MSKSDAGSLVDRTPWGALESGAAATLTGVRNNGAMSLVRRQIRALAVLALLVGGVLGTGYAVYWFTVARSLLAGEHRHDFGVVELEDEKVELEHTFVLTNRGREALGIGDIKSSCGCTVAHPDRRHIGPGETVEIHATLELEREGHKRSLITVIFDGGQRDQLHLAAEVRMQRRLTLLPGKSRLDPTHPTQRQLTWVDYETNAAPPDPSFTIPQGFDVEFEGWRLTKRREVARGLPARWRGTVRIGPRSETSAGEIVIEMPAQQRVTWSVTSGT